ncbi:MAG TPA: hypothetical protein EYQ22_14300 [Gammaproteobacteria bacterium]|nr:hypothetical protein [Gammaproteobacteria bacterium]HIK68503.1 hypothetical protein [Pseudomonadales bacterium]
MKIIMTLAIVLVAGVVRADELSLLSAQGFGFAEASKFPGPRAQFMAKRAAKVDAQRNLLETINGVRVTSGTTVKDMTLESDIIGSRVKGLLQGAFETHSTVTQEDGNWVAEVTMAVCMSSAEGQCSDKPTLASVMQPALKGAAAPLRFSPEAAATEAQTQTSNAETANTQSTGLIIDASGLAFSPMLDVRIQTQEGKELYGPGHVSQGTNWLHWARDTEGAKAMKAVIGESPILIGVASLGEQSQLVVSDVDAIRIFSTNLNSGDFLSQGRVVFIVAGN